MPRKLLRFFTSIILLALLTSLVLPAFAQDDKPTDTPPVAPEASPLALIGSYAFTNTTGTYTELTGDTPFTVNGGGGTLDDGYSADQTIPFPFDFGGTVFTTYRLNTNGWLGFGSHTATSLYSALSGSVNNVIAFVSRDLNNTGAVYSSVTEGVAPNRIHKIQAKNFYRYNTATMTGNAQVWLYETTNAIEIHYGAFAQTWSSGTTVQVGLRGASTGASDVRSLSGTGSGTWINAVVGNSSTATMQLALTTTPDSGRTYRFEPVIAPNLGASTKSAAPAVVRTGETINYQLVIKNNGDAPATDATISDPIPTGATYVAGSVATQGSPAAVYNAGSNAIEWGAAPLAIGEAITVTFQVNVTALSGSSVVNTATYNAANVSGATTKTTTTPVVGCTNDDSYFCADSLNPGPTYNWLDATTGTLILDATTSGGDDRTAAVTLPFPFTYYGATSSDILVGDNGAIVFGATTGTIGFSNTAMSSAPANLIAPFWDDMDTDTGGTYGQVFGTAPNRIYVVEWFDRPHYSNVGSATFEVLFYEGTNQITFQYQDVDFGNASYNNGASATVGIRGATIQYSYNAAALSDLLAIQFTPKAPAITLDKTVGTDPNVCATTDEITLPYGGGDVTYCYEVENTGDLTLNLHDLVDSELGTLLDDFPYALAPGASVFITETATIATTTVNTGTWTSFNAGPINQVSASDTATVTVDLPLPAITLDKTVGTDPNVCATTDEITLPAGGEVTYCYEVTNTGNETLERHDLVDSELGMLLTNFSYTLVPGASAFITETTTLAATTVNTATWTAYNPADGYTSVWATDTATVTVQAPNVPAIALNKTVGTVPGVCAASDSVTVPYGTTVYYCYKAQNTGNVTFAFHSLLDDQLGTLATNLPYVLPPGAFSPDIIVPDTALLSVTNTATWTAASSVGYVYDGNALFNYIPISATGTALGLADDGEANVTLPFPFTYFGVTSSNLRVGNNGGILFDVTTGEFGLTNAALPAATPALSILPFWDDIDSDTGNVYWEVQGTAPNRVAVVEWYNRPHFSNIGAASFEVLLYETSNEIKFQYADVDFGDPLYNNGASATVGLNKDATTALQFSFNQPVIQNGQAILFSPVTIVTASDSDTATVTVQIPNIDVSPLSMTSVQPANTVTNQTLNIGNTGDAPLDWEITETTPDRPARPGVVAAPEPVFDVPSVVSSAKDCAAFENYPGREPAGWAEFCGQPMDAPSSSPASPTSTGYTLNLRTPDRNLKRFTLNNFPGQTVVGAQAANIYGMDFDRDGTTLYALNTSTNQLGTLSTTTGVFTPIVACPAPAGATWTGLSIDPVTNVFYASTAANLYTLDPLACAPTLVGPFGITSGIMIDIAINPAGVMYGHDIFTDSIYTINTSTGAATLVGLTGLLANFAQGMDFDNEDGTLYIFLYQGSGNNTYGTVNLATGAVTALATNSPLGEFEGATQTLGVCVPNDYTWLTTAPISGTVPAAGVTPVTVTFDSTTLADGTYTAQLCIRSNDPDNGPGNGTSLVQVPITLTVEPPTALVLTDLAVHGNSLAPAALPVPVAAVPLAGSLALLAAYWLRRKR